MSILLSFDVAERRRVAASAQSPLAAALRAELSPLINAALPIPQQKVRLTRTGGRCSFDGTYLEFDPYSPHEHRCRQCQRVFMDHAHDDWWAMGAQLWTAERAVQAATLNLLTDDKESGALAIRILNELANRYASWPNADNALGPTRPFFSTYLESIWLLNLCHAISLLEQADVSAAEADVLSHVREKLVQPSRDLVMGFHEGRSNRQVWNEVAILSASHILGDNTTVRARLDGKRGLFDLLAHGLLDDGTWYEGENYHLFAHRGLWYGVQLLRALHRPLPAQLEARYRAGFVTPFLGVLPDDTLPSRRDAQYKVSLRQWRFAEWCELGLAHGMQQPDVRADARLIGTLQRLYNADPSLALTQQHRHGLSTADAERNEPAGLLSRADLSWRALLMAAPVLPEGDAWSPGSVCLPRQGLAVLRREHGAMYIALEGGHTGGGHGHPDRLALTLQHQNARWLEDPGTGSYVDPTLHWYRSTLAHPAPLIDGASQDVVPATLLAFEDRGGAGWICKRVENVKPGVNIQRTVVACEGYLLDVLEWDANREVQIDLPVARVAEMLGNRAFTAADPRGAGGVEDGFDFLTAVEVAARLQHDGGSGPDGSAKVVAFRLDGHVSATVSYHAVSPIELWRAMAPGSPGQDRAPIHWLRMRGETGRLVGVWRWPDHVPVEVSISPDGNFTIVMTTGETSATHTRTPEGWHIALRARHATSSIDLACLASVIPGDPDVQPAQTPPPAQPDVAAAPSRILRAPGLLRIDLARDHYLRTEQTWDEAGRPAAVAMLSVAQDALDIRVFTVTGPIVVPEPHAENVLDNERADVNGDGLELFIGPANGAPWTGSWLAVPANADPSLTFDGPQLRPARITATTPHAPPITCEWAPLEGDVPFGWAMQLRVPLRDIPLQPDGTFVLELIVNERPAIRARRRGMLVLSGGEGFAYLRGDRADSADALTFSIAGV